MFLKYGDWREADGRGYRNVGVGEVGSRLRDECLSNISHNTIGNIILGRDAIAMQTGRDCMQLN